MSNPEKHSRRDFLQGRAAVRMAANQAQQWVDSASELLGSASPPGPVVHVLASRRAMACEFAVQYHEADEELAEAVLAAFDVIESVEDQLTIYRDDSEVIDINHRAAAEPVEVDRGLFELLELCDRLYRDTDGAFDITSGPLSRVWGFLNRAGQLPDSSELEYARSRVGADAIRLDPNSQSIRFHNAATEINFNSIGKGYALDQVATQLDHDGHTDYLWHGGGSSVLARGKNRSGTQPGWTVGLKHPQRPGTRLAEVYLSDRALATAGGATQFFEQDGQRYSHILDPRTGQPAKGVYSSTVLAPSAAEADGLATAFFVMDVDAVEAYCQQHRHISAVLVCPVAEQSDFVVRAFGMTERDWTLINSGE
ncbi:MAG: FAD:protein FMN transferase [Planctomycetota bacterium]